MDNLPEGPFRQWTIEEIQASEEARAYVFNQMLLALEDAGKCSGVFHRLAFVLFGDGMEN